MATCLPTRTHVFGEQGHQGAGSGGAGRTAGKCDTHLLWAALDTRDEVRQQSGNMITAVARVLDQPAIRLGRAQDDECCIAFTDRAKGGTIELQLLAFLPMKRAFTDVEYHRRRTPPQVVEIARSAWDASGVQHSDRVTQIQSKLVDSPFFVREHGSRIFAELRTAMATCANLSPPLPRSPDPRRPGSHAGDGDMLANGHSRVGERGHRGSGIGERGHRGSVDRGARAPGIGERGSRGRAGASKILSQRDAELQTRGE
jgi:hypothetical protein